MSWLRPSGGTDRSVIRHEVLFEKDINAISHRPLFVGQAFFEHTDFHLELAS